MKVGDDRKRSCSQEVAANFDNLFKHHRTRINKDFDSFLLPHINIVLKNIVKSLDLNKVQ